jgi:hypothetical protein
MKYRDSAIALAALAVSVAFAQEGEEASIRKRIDAIKKSDADAWRKIPWTSSLMAARQASEREKQPLFLFTHDGNIETGRC